MDYGQGMPTQMPAPVPQRDWGKTLGIVGQVVLGVAGTGFFIWMLGFALPALDKASQPSFNQPVVLPVPPIAANNPAPAVIGAAPLSTTASGSGNPLRADGSTVPLEQRREFAQAVLKQFDRLDAEAVRVLEIVRVSPTGLTAQNDAAKEAMARLKTNVSVVETAVDTALEKAAFGIPEPAEVHRYRELVTCYAAFSYHIHDYLTFGSRSAWAEAQGALTRARASCQALRELGK